ncbi:MAG: hypothetical protein K2J67_05730 [Lachnospiraceae bacterium]|nr:hypothetical protein [Lachnospiraceae bacterium]
MSVILLTLIVAMSVTTILCIKEGSGKGVKKAHEIVDTPNLWVQFYGYKLTEKMIEDVKNNSKVAKVVVNDFLVGKKTIMNDREYTNSVMLRKAPESVKILKENISGIAGDAEMLDKGEIYVSQGLLTSVNGKVGEAMTIETLAGDYTFTVKGICLEPMVGSSVIGWKTCFISDADYAEIEKAVAAEETEEEHAIGKSLDVYKADSCKLTDAKFRRQVNIDTGIVNMGFGSITKEMSIHYTTLFPQIISSILIVFIILLMGIVLIVTVHGISVEIESNYLTFGILKAQGFRTSQLRVLFLLQYLIAEIIGAALGMLFSIPVIRATINIFAPITGIPAVVSVPFCPILLILSSLFLLSVVFILLVTGRLSKISPVRAISGAKKEIYFDSRINAPICKKLLSTSLALRQFTAAKRRYIGTFMIVAILVFFMMSISMLSNTVTSKSALNSMGVLISEIDVSPKRQLTDVEFADIEKEIERYTKIKERYYYRNVYFSFDGEEIMGVVCKNPETLPVTKGRAPIYDNEIAVAPNLLDEFNLQIGDEIAIGWEDQTEQYMISGTAPLINDAGRCFGLSIEGAKKLGHDWWVWGCYSLEEDKDKDEIAASLNEKFGDCIEARANEEMLDNTYQIAIDSMQLIIYGFSIIFSLVVVQMVCSRSFIGERSDIGIYKSLGFTCVKLRLQFAIRFVVVAILGSLLGSVLCVGISGKMLSMFLGKAGITSFATRFGITTFTVPVVTICISFFIFSYWASGKIKKVGIRELVAE